MKFLSTCSFLLVSSLLISCSSPPPGAPSFTKKNSGNAKGSGVGGGGDDPADALGGDEPAPTDVLGIALNKEFEGFVKAVDELDIKTAESAGKVPALVVQSQLALADIMISNKKEEVLQPKGRCLLFASGDKAFTDKEVTAPELVLSPGTKLVYSKSSALDSSECQKLFKEKLADRYKTDFFNLHEVFYGIK